MAPRGSAALSALSTLQAASVDLLTRSSEWGVEYEDAIISRTEQLRAVLNGSQASLTVAQNNRAERALRLFFRGLAEGEYPAELCMPRMLRALIDAFEFEPATGEEPINKNPTAYSEFVRLLIENWHRSYLSGVARMLLRRRSTLFRKRFADATQELASRLQSELESYHDNKRFLVAVKEVAPYLCSSKPDYRLMLSDQDSDLDTFFDSIGFLRDERKGQFFRDAVLDWLQIPGAVHTLDIGLSEKLSRYYAARDYRVVLAARTIIALSTRGDSDKETVTAYCAKRSGDPDTESLWTLSPKYAMYTSIVEDARALLLAWINEDIITAFFERLIHDERRKRFWLKYVRQAQSVKIGTTRLNLRRFSTSPEQSAALKRRYIQVKGDVSVLFIEGKRRTFLEFSEHGNALYVYEKQRAIDIAKSAEGGRHADFKQTYHPMVGNPADFRTKVNLRIKHDDDWEYRLTQWFKLYGEF